jgi:hypothetical protein
LAEFERGAIWTLWAASGSSSRPGLLSPDRVSLERFATAADTEQRPQDLAAVLDRAINAIDFEVVRAVIDLQRLVEVAAAEQVMGRRRSLAAFLFGSMGYADGAAGFRFGSRNRHAALYWYQLHLEPLLFLGTDSVYVLAGARV